MRFVKERVYPGAHIAAGNPNEHFHHGIVIDPTAPDVSIIHFWGPTAVLTRLRSTTLPAFLAGGVSRIGNRSRRLYLVKYDGDTREKREGTVKVAQEMLAKDDIPFDYTTSNCENFACFCRTGKWESEQIKKIEDLLVVKASDNAMLSSESGLNSPDSASSYSQKP